MLSFSTIIDCIKCILCLFIGEQVKRRRHNGSETSDEVGSSSSEVDVASHSSSDKSCQLSTTDQASCDVSSDKPSDLCDKGSRQQASDEAKSENVILPTSTSSSPQSPSSKHLVSSKTVSASGPVSPQPCSSSSLDPEEPRDESTPDSTKDSLVSNMEVTSSTENEGSDLNEPSTSSDKCCDSRLEAPSRQASYGAIILPAQRTSSSEGISSCIRSQGADIYEKVVKSADAVMALLSRLHENSQN